MPIFIISIVNYRYLCCSGIWLQQTHDNKEERDKTSDLTKERKESIRYFTTLEIKVKTSSVFSCSCGRGITENLVLWVCFVYVCVFLFVCGFAKL